VNLLEGIRQSHAVFRAQFGRSFSRSGVDGTQPETGAVE
jgi:hypothetical protein